MGGKQSVRALAGNMTQTQKSSTIYRAPTGRVA